MSLYNCLVVLKVINQGLTYFIVYFYYLSVPVNTILGIGPLIATFLELGTNKHPISQIMYSLAVIHGFIYITIPVFMFRKRSCFLGIFIDLNRIDRNFKQFNINFSYRWYQIITIGITIAGLFFFIINISFYTFSFETKRDKYMSFSFSGLFLYLSVILYIPVSLYALVAVRIHVLNEFLLGMVSRGSIKRHIKILKEIGKFDQIEILRQANTLRQIKILEYIAKFHFDLCEICNKLSEFSLILILAIGMSLLGSICCLTGTFDGKNYSHYKNQLLYGFVLEVSFMCVTVSAFEIMAKWVSVKYQTNV